VVAVTATHRQEIEAILGGSRAEHRALLDAVSPGLRASLPVDAAGIAQSITRIAELAGLADEVSADLARAHRANPAVLHGRVFGRAPLSPDTVLAAFVDGARVRADVLLRLAGAVGGAALGEEVAALLADHPPPVDSRAPDVAATLRATYAAQEHALVRLAGHLDDDATRASRDD
jgi:hypothetical protein